MAGTSDLPLENVSLADREIQICWGEMLTDWICSLPSAHKLHETTCETFKNTFVRLGCYKTGGLMKYSQSHCTSGINSAWFMK